MFMRKLRKDRRGLSLIELVCGLAILSIITTTVGGAMVVATNSYQRGTTETALQQEAQFTVNTIESLLIDATDKVEFTGNDLTITNTDYTYVINYDPAAKTLTYTQYDTNDPGNVLASNELLAEHVGGFIADTSDFDDSRNVGITLNMLSDNGSTLNLAYNITSRNNPEAGIVPDPTASILCSVQVILEPNQTYVLPVSVVCSGGASTAYTAVMEQDDGHTPGVAVSVVSGGVSLTVADTETGGADGALRLRISTNATGASGAPLATKWVNVYIRRANSIATSLYNLKSGSACAAGAVYEVTADPVGTHFAKVDAEYDEAPYAWKDPSTIKWTVAPDSASYFEIIDGTANSNTVRVRLKQDIPAGVTAKMVATSKHAAGVVDGVAWNKTGSMYSNLYVIVPLAGAGGGPHLNDIIRRGTETTMTYNAVPSDLVASEQNVAANPGAAYNGGFQGRILYRFVSTDGTHKSSGYPGWIVLTEGGLTAPDLKFNCADLTNTYFMKEYTLELCYSFRYNTMNNQPGYYPAGSENPSTFDPAPKYVTTVPVMPFSVKFEKYYNSANNETRADLPLTGDSDGIGTQSNPLKLKKGGEITFWYNNVTGASNQRPETVSAWTGAKVRKWNGVDWATSSVVNAELGIGDRNGDQMSGTFRLNTVNGGLGSAGTGLYRLEMGDVQNNGLHITETYVEEAAPGAGGRGYIYFELY